MDLVHKLNLTAPFRLLLHISMYIDLKSVAQISSHIDEMNMAIDRCMLRSCQTWNTFARMCPIGDILSSAHMNGIVVARDKRLLLLIVLSRLLFQKCAAMSHLFLWQLNIAKT